MMEQAKQIEKINKQKQKKPPQSLLTQTIKYFCKCFYYKSQKQNQYSIQKQTKQPLDIPQQSARSSGKKTLVIDLDETLVHSSFTKFENADHIIQIQKDGKFHKVYINIRPGAKEFIKYLQKYYEIFIYTASVSEYASPVIDIIDQQNLVSCRLYRENCIKFNNLNVKDLATLNRNMKDIILIDNSPQAFMFQPTNAFKIKSFFKDKYDSCLYSLIPFLQLLADFDDVRPVHEQYYKYLNYDQFIYTNTKGEQIIFDHNENLDDQNEKNICKSDQNQGNNMMSPKNGEKHKLLKMNKTSCVNTNQQFNVEYLNKINTDRNLRSEDHESSEEIDTDQRQQLGLNSPIEVNTNRLFQSLQKQDEMIDNQDNNQD